MNKKEISEFQKRVFLKIDEAMEEYMAKQDMESATAFALKIKDRVEMIFEAIQTDKLKYKSKEEREERFRYYQKQIEEYIPKIKEEVIEMVKRQNNIPFYIGFIERRFKENEKDS
jgi:phosphoenolpyruvate carboxylase